ncbi:MAG TPA: E2 ligase fold family C protein, partial [Archangium sp.]
LISLGAPVEARQRLAARAVAINPTIEITEVDGNLTAVLVIGATPYTGAATPVYVGSDGWVMRVSDSAPVGSGSTTNPFGAAAAACVGCANVFRAVFREHLPAGAPDQHVEFSLLTLGAPGGVEPQPSDGVDLGETFLGGIGAIGNAAVWALARVPGLAGTLHLIDHETVELSNLQRYVLADQEAASRCVAKVDLAADVLRAAGAARGEHGILAVHPHKARWGEYLAARGNWNLERVATAFDTIDARLDVQAALPRRIFNAWTQLGDLGVSRHRRFGDTPCLGCQYPRVAGGKSEAEQIGDAMGLPGAPPEIRALLLTSEPLTEPFVRGVAARRGVQDPEGLARLLGYVARPLRAFYSEMFCGGTILRLTDEAGGMTQDVEAPVAFQSALAGVMLAAELVIDALGLRTETAPGGEPTQTTIDVLRPFPRFPNLSTGRRADGTCLCHDADFLARYAEKYRDGS